MPSQPQDLCTVEQVKAQMLTNEFQHEPLIEALISTASSVIGDWTQREFTQPEQVDPDNPVEITRTFTHTGGPYLWLTPYDLRAASEVAVDGTTMTATTGYVFRPVPPPNGVYDRISWRTSLPANSYGEWAVSVTGDWGWPSVPDAVRQACILTVRAWLTREAGIAYQDEGGLMTAPPVNYWIPRAAQRLLGPFKRRAIG